VPSGPHSCCRGRLGHVVGEAAAGRRASLLSPRARSSCGACVTVSGSAAELTRAGLVQFAKV
jgi:hypothetical protein